MDSSEGNEADTKFQKNSLPRIEKITQITNGVTVYLLGPMAARLNRRRVNSYPSQSHRPFKSASAAFSDHNIKEHKRDGDENLKYLSQDQQMGKIQDMFENNDENPAMLRSGPRETFTNLQPSKFQVVTSTNCQYDAHEIDHAVTDQRNNLRDPSPIVKQLVQTPTPFKKLVERFRQRSILVIGFGTSPSLRSTEDENRKALNLASSLGFKDIYTPDDYYTVYPHLAPGSYQHSNRMSAQAKKLHNGRNHKGPWVEIKAILVLGNTRNSGIASQLTSNNFDYRSNDEGKEHYRGQRKGFRDSLPTKLLVPILKSHTGDLRIESPFNGKKCLPNEGWQQAWAPKMWFDGPGLGTERCEELKREMKCAWWRETGRRACEGLILLDGREE